MSDTNAERVEKINAFIQNPDLSGNDVVLKNMVLETNKELQEARQQLDQLSEQLRNKQVQVIQLGSKLDGFLDMIVRRGD